MKTVILLALFAMATAAHHGFSHGSLSRRTGGFSQGSGGFRGAGSFGGGSILIDQREGPTGDGSYSFNFQTADGISRQEQGSPLRSTGSVASQGDWAFTFPDGTPADFQFVADEGGYRVESPLLPTPPPLPAHAINQIEKARQEAAAGVRHSGSGSGGLGFSSGAGFGSGRFGK